MVHGVSSGAILAIPGLDGTEGHLAGKRRASRANGWLPAGHAACSSPGPMLDMPIKGTTVALRHAPIHDTQRGAALEGGGAADHRTGGGRRIFIKEGASSPGPVRNRLVRVMNEA